MNNNKRNTFSFLSALFAGLFLIFSGTSGVGAWKNVQTIAILLAETPAIKIIFTIILIIASFGGLAVITGGVFILQRKNLLGRIFILIGAGAGIITLLARILITFVSKEFAFAFLFSTGTIGVLLAVLANKLAKPKTERMHKRRYH